MQGALDGKTTHVVCASFVLFSLKSSTQLYNYYRITVEENSVKHVLPDGFFGIQILPNSISAGSPHRTPLGELTMLPRLPSPELSMGPFRLTQPNPLQVEKFGPNPTQLNHQKLKNLDPTQPNPTQPNLTHGSTQPMDNSALVGWASRPHCLTTF